MVIITILPITHELSHCLFSISDVNLILHLTVTHKGENQCSLGVVFLILVSGFYERSLEF